MLKEIVIQETVSRYITYTVDVQSEDELDDMVDELGDYVDGANHPDDIICAFETVGANVVEICKGAEDVEYEL